MPAGRAAPAEEVRFERPAQEQEPFDQRSHVVEFVDDDGDRVPHLDHVGVLLAGQHLEVPPGHRQRGPQLMRHVGEQAALQCHGRLQPVQHGVERRRQLAHLVVGTLVTEPAVQVTALDRRRRRRDAPDRAEEPAEQQVGTGHRPDEGDEGLADDEGRGPGSGPIAAAPGRLRR